MLSVRNLIGLQGNMDQREKGRPIPFLSVFLLCRWPQEEAAAKMIVTTLGEEQKEWECSVLIEPALSSEDTRLSDFIAWCGQQGHRVITFRQPCGLPALSFDEGLLTVRGRWVWLLDAQNPVPEMTTASVCSLLRPLDSPLVPVLVHPDDQSEFLIIPGVRPLWIDMLYKGWQFPFENIFFPGDLFCTQGLLDPHIALASFFGQEFLLRISRFVQFEKIVDRRAIKGKSDRFPAIFYYWLDADRRRLLLPSHILDYAFDDLEQFHKSIPEKERWQAYVNYILPYYYRYRHLLPDGFLNLPQSLPPKPKHFLCVKSDHYATTTDVTVRNFDVWAQGEHFYKLSYISSAQIEPQRIIRDDALLLLRTVETSTLNLAEKAVKEGTPVGYALDDDLLNMFENYEAMASFRPGNPGYDAMVDTLRLADTVICGGPHTERAVRRVNPRTVQFDASVLPQFMPELPVNSRPRSLFKFGYAGGSYRVEEMRLLWPAIEQIRREYGDRVCFEFWGLDPSQLSDNLEGISFVPFTISYYEYLDRLKSTGFQAMLIPLLSQPAHRRGKLPVKLWETAAAGAVGLYSDVPVYRVVKTNKLGLLVDESTEAWYKAMRHILDMPSEEYADLQTRSIAYVQEFYTTPAVLPLHEHGLEAILFHGATRSVRNAGGRPRLLYVFPVSPNGWKNEKRFRSTIDLAQKSGIGPEIIIPDGAQEFPEWAPFRKYLDSQGMAYTFLSPREPSANALDRTGLRNFLTRNPVALVHAFEQDPALRALCAELDIPCISPFPDFPEGYYPPASQNPSAHKPCTLAQSSRVPQVEESEKGSGTPWFCIRQVVPESLFTIGFDRLYGPQPLPDSNRPVRIGLIGPIDPDYHQREAILAIAHLIEAERPLQLEFFYEGISFPEYYDQCQQLSESLKIKNQVLFKGKVPNGLEIDSNLDILVSLSRSDHCSGVGQAMACGILVVALPGGDLSELLNDGIDSILVTHPEPEGLVEALERAIALPPPELLRIRRQAFRLARQEFHPNRGLKDLLAMYNLALKIHAPQISIPGKGPQEREPAPGSPIPIGHGLRYRILPQQANWTGLDLPVGIHSRQIKGILEMKVLFGRQVFRKVSRDLALFRDNDWLEFRFDPISNSAGRPFTLEFKVTDAGTRPSVHLYENNRPENAPLRLLRRIGMKTSGNALHCRQRYLGKE